MKILLAYAARYIPGRLVFGLVLLLAVTQGMDAQRLSFGEKPADWDRAQAPCEKPPALREPLDVAYPAAAMNVRQQGVAIVAAYIDARANVTYGEVERSSGFPMLDSAALAAVRQGYFKACWRNGGPQGARLTVPVEFRLPGGQDWNVDKRPDELLKDVQQLKQTKQAVEDQMRAIEEEIRQLRAKQDSIKNAKK